MKINLDFIKKTTIQPSVELVGYGKCNMKCKNINLDGDCDYWDCDCICYECNDGDDDACNCETGRWLDCDDCNCDCDCYDCDCREDCDCDCSTNCYTAPKTIINNYAAGGTHIVGVRFVTQTSGCYYYIGDNRTYNIGDKVVVKTADGAEQMATVIFKKIYKDGETLPYNKNLLKTILRKL